MSPVRPHVVVIGGGVAALEAVLALRALAGTRPAITMLAPEQEFSPPAVSVATPFGFGPPPSLPLEPFAEQHEVQLQRGFLGEVDRVARTAVPMAGEPIPYDHLLVAVGARRRATVRGALTFRGPGDAEAVEKPLGDLASGRARRLAIAVPSTATWSLPAYELAIMAAVELRSRGVAAPDVCVVTPEAHPLEVFGETAGQAIAELLAARRITLHAGCLPTALVDGELRIRDGDAIPADRVIALAEAVGPFVPGLPSDALGFLPTDAHALVSGCVDVYAAGDATAFPLRQGGLAAQQADAAAESIAARMGAIAQAQPFRPVLRGVLLTGGAPLYLRTVIGDGEAPVARRLGAGPSSAVGRRALWWPPAKVAGRYLAPLMATARPVALSSTPLQDLGFVASPTAEGDEDALALALLLADEDARCGDYRQALHALGAARALTGGVLPEAYAAKQRDWSLRA
jgi:sulfide:quinone oxidoreductase